MNMLFANEVFSDSSHTSPSNLPINGRVGSGCSVDQEAALQVIQRLNDC